MRSKSDEYTSLTSEDGPKPTKADEDYLSIPAHLQNKHINHQYSSLKWYKNWKIWLKIFILLSVIVFLILAIIYNKTTWRIFRQFLDWMQNNVVLGSFAFIGIYWLCTVLMIPGSLLTLGAGFGLFLSL